MKRLRLLRPAETEMLEAAQYYETQTRNLGAEFLGKLETAFKDIATKPERWPVIRNEVRRRLVHRFPFAVFYRVEPTEVVVLAVAHLRRRPEYWTER
ncbi:MAG: hypothetical protein PCFJNLEI_01525 [Verrucomicrobiae bacterium]|nr:hypothetical protein [Verrucomicrobiae bacterium]